MMTYKKFKYLYLTLLLISISSCGTILTQNYPEKIKLRNEKKSLSRIYSGTKYYFYMDPTQIKSGGGQSEMLLALGLIATDFVLSIVADTLILPYTSYQQITKGDILVENF